MQQIACDSMPFRHSTLDRSTVHPTQLSLKWFFPTRVWGAAPLTEAFGSWSIDCSRAERACACSDAGAGGDLSSRGPEGP